MKQPALIFFDLMSTRAYNASMRYKFSKHIDYGSQKKKDGIVAVLVWVNELSYFYMEEEKKLQQRFMDDIKQNEQYLRSSLLVGDYKEGIIKGFTLTHELIEQIKKENKT